MSFRDLIFKSQKTKEQIVLFSYLKPKTKNVNHKMGDAVAAGTRMEWGLEREGLPSL